jgi:hypothetical protein
MQKWHLACRVFHYVTLCLYVCMYICLDTTGTLGAFNWYSTITNLSMSDEYGDPRSKKKKKAEIPSMSPHTQNCDFIKKSSNNFYWIVVIYRGRHTVV